MRQGGAPLVLLPLLLLSLPCPAAALVPVDPGSVAAEATAPMSQDAATDFLSAMERAQAGDCEDAVAAIDRMLARRIDPALVAAAQNLRGNCLLALGRKTQAQIAFAAADMAAPDDLTPVLPRMTYALSARAPEIAWAAFERIAAREPRLLGRIDLDTVFSILRSMRQEEGARADSALVALARGGYGGENSSIHDRFALEAAGVLIRRNDLSAARSVAAGILDRPTLVALLTIRLYAPLWRETEARIGPHMALAEEGAIARARAILADNPDSLTAQHNLLRALRAAGRFAEGDRIGAAFAATPLMMADLTQPGAWFVNDHALLLAEAGRLDDADRRMAALRVNDVDSAPWLVSMIINRVDILTSAARWDAALPLADEAATIAARHGSPYARQLVRRYRICALAATNRAAEAASDLQALRDHADDGTDATVEGLLCAGRIDEAETILLALLAEPDEVESATDLFQPAEAQYLAESRVANQAWDAIRARPAVRTAFDRIGRVLPRRFWPASPTP